MLKRFFTALPKDPVTVRLEWTPAPCDWRIHEIASQDDKQEFSHLEISSE